MVVEGKAVDRAEIAVDREGVPGQSLVLFQLAQQTYALPIAPIAQIIPMVTITPLPQVSDTVEGVINVRGEVVPVVDMRHHLGLAKTPWRLHTPIILIHLGDCTVGLIVDEVMDVLSLPATQIVRPADILPKEVGRAPVLQGVVRFLDRMALFIDPGHLFLPHQVEALAQAARMLPGLVAREADASVLEAQLEAVDERATGGSPGGGA